MINVEQIKPNPHQPRQTITDEELQPLVDSVRQTGVIQPIVVRQARPDGYELIAGERRWRACRIAGIQMIPAVLREATDQEMAELALIENIFREDLNAIERATAYKRYADEFQLSADQIAQRLGEDRTTVTNYMRLLDLPAEVKDWLAQGRLAMGHARCLLAIKSPADLVETAREAINKDLSVRALEEVVRQRASGQPTPKQSSAKEKRPQIRSLEESFVRSLSTKVEINESRRKGSGKIVIHYYSLEDFDRISEKLGVDLD